MAISSGDGSIVLTTKIDQSGFDKGLGSMASGAKNIGEIFAKMGVVAAKAFVAVGVAATAATVAITKQAVEAYAEYEQLAGGVETLFKESSQTLINYANQAFKTSGMSANKYMQSVTSFSASMIASVGGDTAKAAELSNQAMIAISDNANKMGTDVESIIMTYQSLARGNVGMLDNLKLGYGGTKAELQRLIKDAEAYKKSMGEVVNYDVSNFADVTQAIQAIQEKLGIAGATALEASTTIQGSAMAMKASWENVLTYMATGGGDLDNAIENLVDTIAQYMENIVPVVERALVGIGTVIEKVAPLLVQRIASALIQSIPSLLNAIYQMVIGLAKGIYEGVKALFSGSVVSVVEEQSAQISTSVENQEALTDAVEDTEKAMKKTLAGFDDLQIISSGAVENVEAMEDAVAVPTISAGITATTEQTLQTSTGEGDNVASASPVLSKIREEVDHLAQVFAQGFWQGFGDADFSKHLSAIKSIGEELKEIFVNVLPNIKNFVSGYVSGFSQMIGSIASIGSTIAKNIFGAFDKYITKNKTFLQKKLASIFDAGGLLYESVGKLWTSFAEIFSVFGQENATNLMSEIIESFANAGLGVFDLVYNWGADIVTALTTAISDNTEGLKNILDDVFGFFADIFAKINETVTYTLEEIKRVYDESVAPYIETVGEVISEWITVFTEAWEEHISPTLSEISEKISVTFDEHVRPAIDKAIEFFQKWAEVLTALWKNVLQPVVSWIIEKLVPSLSSEFTRVGDIISVVYQVVSDVVGGIFDALGGLLDFVIGVFTGDWEKAWLGIKEYYAGIWNAIVGIAEGAVNLVISAINGIIRGFNNISGALGDLLGFDFTVSEINEISIPRIGQGTVVPSNASSTYARQAANGSLNSWQNIASGGGGSASQIVLELNGRELGRAIVEQGNAENRRIGTRLVMN